MCYFIFYGIISIVLMNIINPIIRIFFGDDRVMPLSSALLVCLLFYIRNNKNLFGTYKTSLGLYWFDRYRPLITGLTDLILSMILGHFIGFNGIILGTIIAYTAIDLWVEPLIIFHRGFHASSRRYIATTMLRMVFVVGMMLLTEYLTAFLPGSGITNLVLRFITSSILTIFIFYILYHKNKYVIESYKAVKRYIFKKEC